MVAMRRRSLERTVGALRRHPRVVAGAQVVALVVFMVFALWAIRHDLDDASTRVRQANVLELALGCAGIAVYYLLFVVGWMRILAAWDAPLGYPAALRAEMVSMLAKYVPGGIWTPAARVVAARRAGLRDTGLVTASILIEAALSAIAGVLVFVVSLVAVGGDDAPVELLVAFALVLAAVLHPRVFGPVASAVVRKLGGRALAPLPARTMLALVAYYAFTWVVGGVALFFLVRSVGGDPPLTAIPYLGGVGAVGAIVAVLSVFAPSGLGPREASMYALLLAVTSPAAALGATVVNRLAITLVEVLLLVVGGVWLRAPEPGQDAAVTPAAEPSQ
jgi:uncharacterized membrane protein YbhN (UPF0104 family)